VYAALGRVEMAHLVDVEERVMARFAELFEMYLGSACYNSFVMTRDQWATFQECLPDLAGLDGRSGAADRRPLRSRRPSWSDRSA
jgi:hypothetical protein